MTGELLPTAGDPGLISLWLSFGAPIYMLVAIAWYARSGDDDAISCGIITGLVVTAALFFWFAVLPLVVFGGACKLVVRLASPPKPAPSDAVLNAAEAEVERLLATDAAPSNGYGGNL